MFKPIALGLSILSSIPQVNFEFFKSFLPGSCCWTNECCFKITLKDVTDLGNGRWMINATKQIVPKENTYKSPDGNFWRCACDYNSATGNWDVHLNANTRCLAIPPFSS